VRVMSEYIRSGAFILMGIAIFACGAVVVLYG
jgi:hypothetical protein